MGGNEDQKFFSDFPDVKKSEWLELASKGRDEKGYLIWNTVEGFEVDPFYTVEDLNNKIPVHFPSVGGNEWKYYENILVKDDTKTNEAAILALNSGADGIILDFKSVIDVDFPKIMKDIMPEHCFVTIKVQEFNKVLLKNYFKFIQQKKLPSPSFAGAFIYDPIAEWTLKNSSELPDINSLKIVFDTASSFPNYKAFSIGSEVFKNSGSNHAQEAALLLCSFLAYLKELGKRGVEPETVFKKSFFLISVGTEYFFEIAKLRSIKSLILKIANAYGMKDLNLEDLHFHVETSWWSKTAKDPYTNILRNTTEAMAGILGGCNSISILPHDVALQGNNGLSERVSRNISNILKEEAYFNKVADPASGSYYLESLTHLMQEKIWQYLQDIEQKGGFIEAFRSGYIKAMVQENYVRSIDEIIKAQKKVIGTNYHTNEDDMDLILKAVTTRRSWFDWSRLTEKYELGKLKQ